MGLASYEPYKTRTGSGEKHLQVIASDSRENNQQSLAKLHTFSLLGIEAVPVDVEVDVSQAAIPKTILVGLPETAVKESTQRVERAMVNSGYRPPSTGSSSTCAGRTPKTGRLLRSAHHAGCAGRQWPTGFRSLRALRGRRRLIAGRPHAACERRLSMAMSAARQQGLRGLVVPDTNTAEAAVVEDLEVISVNSLAEAAAFFAGHRDIGPVQSRLQELFNTFAHYDDDYADVRGQESANRGW